MDCSKISPNFVIMIVSELLEQLGSYQSDTAENNEKFVVSSGI